MRWVSVPETWFAGDASRRARSRGAPEPPEAVGPERAVTWPEWICFHVPHASRTLPDAVWPSYLLSETALERELDRLTDHWIDELLVPDVLSDRMVRAAVSRFVVDVERFADDDREPMAERGMGAVYLRTTDGRPLRAEPDPEERERLLALHYHTRTTPSSATRWSASREPTARP